ncbi:glycosyltransferase family 4 protein [Kaistia adipata]|uniref:glycosyltransferase family 4 protein n=1 Tax=Kaistia adipata TaxID=166954 RepID=UPI00040D08ED|nr:glycosyltransferase family 4 protein [Kaistia adipata]
MIQDGSRLRYALPLALQSAGILARMHTDFYVRRGSPQAALAAILASLPRGAGQRLAGRRCPELDDDKVSAPSWTTLVERLCESRATRSEERYVGRSRSLARHVLRHGLENVDGLAGFVRNIDPLLCEWARSRKITVILDQMIAPIEVETRASNRQAALWPGWEKAIDPVGPLLMREIERRSWAAADHITCASDYVRDGLILEGSDPERVSVLPYPIDTRLFTHRDRSRRAGPVRIGFVGTVSLRKGAPAFLKIAHAFDPKVAEFIMVGPSLLEPGTLEREKGDVRLAGAVPAAAIPAWLERFDVFFFPSTCEGSAGAVLEAMAMGLPIVTTPESGTHARNGIEGFVHGCEDLDGMARSLARLVGDGDLRARMGWAGRQRAETMTISQYGAAWRALLERQL